MESDWCSRRYLLYRTRISVSIALGAIGMGTSVATVYAAPLENARVLSCGLNALSCNVALNSSIAKIAGIPLGVFGLMYFCFWTLCLHAFRESSNDTFRVALSWLTLLGAIASVSLACTMFIWLKAPCLWCLLTHSCNLIAFVLLWPILNWRIRTIVTREQLRHFIALAAISILASFTLYLAHKNRSLAARLSQFEDDHNTAFLSTW